MCNSMRGDTNFTEWIFEKPIGIGAWGIDHGIDFSEIKKDPEFITEADYLKKDVCHEYY